MSRSCTTGNDFRDRLFIGWNKLLVLFTEAELFPYPHKKNVETGQFYEHVHFVPNSSGTFISA